MKDTKKRLEKKKKKLLTNRAIHINIRIPQCLRFLCTFVFNNYITELVFNTLRHFFVDIFMYTVFYIRNSELYNDDISNCKNLNVFGQ